jgi:hypothetical protein
MMNVWCARALAGRRCEQIRSEKSISSQAPAREGAGAPPAREGAGAPDEGAPRENL